MYPLERGMTGAQQDGGRLHCRQRGLRGRQGLRSPNRLPRRGRTRLRTGKWIADQGVHDLGVCGCRIAPAEVRMTKGLRSLAFPRRPVAGRQGSGSTWGCVLTVPGLNREEEVRPEGKRCAQKERGRGAPRRGEADRLLGAPLSLTCFVSHVTSPGLSALRNLEIVTEIRRKVAQSVERPRLQLTSPLARHAQFPSYRGERLRRLPR